MPSVFEAQLAQLEAAVDDQFGEPFLYQPMLASAGGGRRSEDPSRPAKPITGVYDDGSFASRALGEVERTASKITLRQIHVSVLESAFDMPPRRFDRLTRIESGLVLEIADDPQDAAGRYKLRVVYA